MKLEAKVGLFIVIGFLALFVLSIKLSTFSNMGNDGYTIYAVIDNATGLEKNAKVKINGVKAGYITSIKLQNGKPLLDLFIFKNIKIASDSKIIIKQESFLGGKFVEIEYGKSQEYLNSGSVVKNNHVYASMDETTDSINSAANEFKALVKKLNKVLDDNTTYNFQVAIENFKNMGSSLKKTSDKFYETGNIVNKRLPKIMAQIDSLTYDLNITIASVKTTLPNTVDKFGVMADEFTQTGKTLNKKLPKTIDKFDKVGDELYGVLNENRKPINNAIKSADSFFKSGEDAFDEIGDMVSKVSTAKLEIDLKGNYMLKDQNSKTSFVVAYIPSLSNYYILELVSTSDYSETNSSGSLIEPEKHDEGKMLITAQVGKRYSNVLFRAGFKESTGGVGLDLFSTRDILKASLDFYDFNAVNDIRGDSPHAVLEFRYRPIQHLNFYAGADNFLNKDAENYYVGMGINFIDDDLKYLLISAGSMAK